jgi:Flp pilus assembly protein TadG
MTTHVSRGRGVVARRWRALRSAPDRGYSAVEAAIVMPIVLILTMTVIQLVLLWHGRHVAQAAAAAAARSSAAYHSTAAVGQADGKAYLDEVAPNLLRNATVTVTRTATAVQVTVDATVLSVIPLGDGFTVTESVGTSVEIFSSSTSR